MKYNRLLSFIYKKDFRRPYRHRAMGHSAQHQRSTTANAKLTIPRKKQVPTGAKKERKHQKKKEN